MRLARNWLPALLWMAVIFVFSSDVGAASNTSRILGPLLHWLWPGLPPEEVGRVVFALRKAGHVFEYAVLAVLLARGFRGTLAAPSPGRVATGAWLAAVAYAMSDEWHQSFVATRTGSAGDVVIDACGAALGLALAALVARRKS